LEPDYFGFQTASNQMWVGYGLADAVGTGRNARNLSAKRISASNKKSGSRSRGFRPGGSRRKILGP